MEESKEISVALDELQEEKPAAYTHLQNYWIDVRDGMKAYGGARIDASKLYRSLGEPEEPSSHALGHVLSGMYSLELISLEEQRDGRPNEYGLEEYDISNLIDVGIELEARKHQAYLSNA